MENTGLHPTAPRTDLMVLLDELSQAKQLIYIHAPAGYGKTFSTRIWLKHNGDKSAWVAVNESAGRKPAEFYERLAMAMLTLQPGNAVLKDLIAQNSFASFAFMERARNAFKLHNIETGEQKMALVIDDLHFITSADIIKNLPEIIDLLPENITVFTLSRSEPPESFSEFVVKNLLTVVNVERLKFSESEIKSFFASVNKKLTPAQAREVLAATGGWAIGLNAILLSDNYKYSGKRLSRYLEKFISEQVWGKWNKERRDFILRVSVADELTADFCDRIAGRKDSKDVLDLLVSENAFLSVDAEGVYRFHHLFQDFLAKILDCENEQLKKTLFQTAGDWFYDHENYYKAVEYYIKCGSKSGIAKGLRLMYNYNSPYASVEDTASIIRLSVNRDIVEEYPFLLETLAWEAFVDGSGDEMERYIDRYFKHLPKAILQNPASALTSILLRCMDYRKPMIEVLRGVQKLPFKRFAHANTPSITQNMPFFHRSSRDYTEFFPDVEDSFNVLRKTWGVLLGEEYEVVEKSIRAGFCYEQGDLDAAHELALSACAAVGEHYASEVQFCATMILAAIYDAQDNRADVHKAFDKATDMIRRHKAYYLEANLEASQCRLKLHDGSINAARDWLKYNAEPSHGHLPFYRLYRHFTTARAYIVTGEYNTAILFLKKLLSLCEQYRRPLDIIEAKILIAISYWKKSGAASQNEALTILEQAAGAAMKYGFVQVFANEGAELSNILYKLQNRVAQKDYSGEISITQIKMLYIMALARAKHSRGLTGGRARDNIKFTERQKEVMRYLSEGLTHKEMAVNMGIKTTAVKSHMMLIYKKLDVSNGTDAMVKIQELGLLK